MRATTENYALDSYQNLLFSISRFHEYTGRFPENITIIGYGFKRDRFVDLHRAAIRWPLDRFQYIGIDADDESSLDAQQGEVSFIIVAHQTRPGIESRISKQMDTSHIPATCMAVIPSLRPKEPNEIHIFDSILIIVRHRNSVRFWTGARTVVTLQYSLGPCPGITCEVGVSFAVIRISCLSYCH